MSNEPLKKWRLPIKINEFPQVMVTTLFSSVLKLIYFSIITFILKLIISLFQMSAPLAEIEGR